MADSDIEGETRTAYRLKEGVPIAIFDRDSYFEPFELPVVELKESDTIVVMFLNKD